MDEAMAQLRRFNVHGHERLPGQQWDRRWTTSIGPSMLNLCVNAPVMIPIPSERNKIKRRLQEKVKHLPCSAYQQRSYLQELYAAGRCRPNGVAKVECDVDGIDGHINGCSSRGRPRERNQRQRPLQYVTFKSRRCRQVAPSHS